MSINFSYISAQNLVVIHSVYFGLISYNVFVILKLAADCNAVFFDVSLSRFRDHLCFSLLEAHLPFFSCFGECPRGGRSDVLGHGLWGRSRRLRLRAWSGIGYVRRETLQEIRYRHVNATRFRWNYGIRNLSVHIWMKEIRERDLNHLPSLDVQPHFQFFFF